MKKYLVIAMFAIAAFGFVGCSEDADTKADLRWQNNGGADVKEIKWVHNGSVDQSWDETTIAGNPSAYKGIYELAGTADCIDNTTGAPYTIGLTATGSTGYSTISEGGSSATITENAAATLVMDTLTAK